MNFLVLEDGKIAQRVDLVLTKHLIVREASLGETREGFRIQRSVQMPENSV